MYKVILAKQAVKDFEKLKAAHLLPKAKALVEILAQNPYQNPPPYEKLVGNLKGIYSRRINIQHRLIYNILEEQKTVHILRMWTHYE
ncbi:MULTISPECIES: Txe/YoeB family addiction module toxin [Caproicibacterium]|uniref:Endoribonuclease YoeB n=1 Tax=Caproicibacterium argilliputei TaxID=3030016 RepID=A0AA97H3Y7_9FIRM|nr:Txe/YoeB family addiction module toxin [Caproicibacterium argilliputei]WOC32823.1 Txe/YoeB family addiction module toxin [Caproicibacterium argilliputei]